MNNVNVAALAASAIFACTAALAEYPEKPVEVIMPWPAGVATDVGSRIVVEQMSEELGVPLQVIAKPGGRGVIGTADLVAASPDGYTIGTVTVGPAVTQVLMGNTPYQIEDLEPIGVFMTLPFLLLAGADAPFDDVEGLATHATSEEVTLGHWGLGAVPTLAIYRIAQARGFEFKEVTFSPVNSSQLTSGDADIVTVTTEGALGAIQAGQAKPIVAMTPSRMSNLPELATVREQGDEFDVGIWTAMFAPKGTPQDVISELATALESALSSPEVTEYAQSSGTVFTFAGPEAAREIIAGDAEAYNSIMQQLGLK